MNTISITSIGAIVLGLLAAIAVAFPVSAAELGLETGVSVGSDMTVTPEKADADAAAAASASTSSNTSEEERRGTFTILRSSLTADADTSVTPKDPASVKSESDLSAYTTAALRSDDQIDAVTYNDDNVEVTYYEQGRLLMVIPVTMKTTAKVAGDGTVTVSYPWYRFLVASDTNVDVQSDIQTRVDAWKASVSGDAAFNASAKAALMDEVRAAIR